MRSGGAARLAGSSVAARGATSGAAGFVALSIALFALFMPRAALADASPAAVSALLYDLDKIVEVQASLGWKIDKYEYEKMMPDALLSVCRSTDEARLSGLAEMDERIDELGGPLEEAYRAKGNSLSGLGALVQATRVRALLEEASRRASTECPLGMDPEADFKGLQTDADRFTLSGEGGGLFTLQRWAGGPTQFGGGGSGRLLLGRGISTRFTILFGIELGATAIFDQKDTGTKFPLQFTGAAPLIFRHQRVTWHFDFEMAPLCFATSADPTVSAGGRFGFLIGVSALRVRKIMPSIGVGLAAEYIGETDERPALLVGKGGLRVGFDWDY